MNCRLLVDDDFQGLYRTFNMAFSEYAVKLQPTEEEFLYRIKNKLHMDRDISAAAFDGNEMLGFIVHASNIYQGIPTAYNGGTGVLPGFRNQKTAEQLYTYLIPKIQAKFLARILLEVIDTNENAIRLYEKIGFVFKRSFMCYKQTERIKVNNPVMVKEGTLSDVDFSFMDFDSSFLDSEEHLKRGTESVLIAYREDKPAGYVIYQPHLSRISQLSVSRFFRQQGVGGSLVFELQKRCKKALTIMNIPDTEFGFDAFLTRCGFENQINQFEMELII